MHSKIALVLFTIATIAGASPYGGVSYVHSAPVQVQTPALTSQSQNTYRSYDGSQSVSSFSKSIDTAFSSVNKYDTRITNDGKLISPIGYAAQPIAYAAYPAHQVAYPSQQIAYHSSPVLTKTIAAPVLTKTIASPVIAHQPAVIAHQPAAIAQPIAVKTALHYSSAPLVSHVTYTGLGVNYGW